MGQITRFRGEGAARGIAIGPAYLLAAKVTVAERRILRQDRDAELAHLEDGIAATNQQLEELQRGLPDDGGAGRDLIEVHKMILRSQEMAGHSRRLIADECFSAEWAVTRAMDQIRKVFLSLLDPYFRERGGDFEAVGERLLRVLLGLPELRAGGATPAGSIAVGIDLSPLDPYHLKRAGVAGIVTDGGGTTSHTSIVARALGLPYVLGVKQLSGRVRPGSVIILDGARGDIVLDPTDETLQAYRARAAAECQREEQLSAEKDLLATTTDGVRIHLRANVESLVGVAAAMSAGAEGIGLFRTEFLYLERPDLPTEEEQYRDAVSALEAVHGQPVTFRTLDLGADKLPLAIKLPEGPNPALGLRSIRFSLERPEIFRTQLRALYRAAAVGPMRLMLPLVSGVTELQHARAICSEVRAQLMAEGIAHDPGLPIGIMLETPSAALTTDHLAHDVDFFSIGTNDLIQFTFAADRDNVDVRHLRQPTHPAVLRLLKSMIDAAGEAHVPISICGDMASDPLFTWLLLGLGLRELSMDSHCIPVVKSIIRRSSLAEAVAFSAEALTLRSEGEVTSLAERTLRLRFGAELDFLPSSLASSSPTAESPDTVGG